MIIGGYVLLCSAFGFAQEEGSDGILKLVIPVNCRSSTAAMRSAVVF